MTKSAIPALDDLIATIESRADDPLNQLTAAVLVGAHLDELSDHLIGHFVDKARHSGASWTTIGQSLGVTKQAAQKRFVPSNPDNPESDPRIFSRYTEDARKVVLGAQQQAQQRGAAEIRPGHLLLAVLDHQPVPGDVDAIRAAVADVLGSGSGPTEAAIPFSAASKKAIELGHREALRRGDEHIEPRHLLLGVLGVGDEPDVVAAGLDKDELAARL